MVVLEQSRLDELRHLWHALAEYRRSVKVDPRFGALHELTPVETGVIDLIADNPKIIMREIGESLNLPKSTLTSLIDRLEKRECLHRVVSDRDRRSYGIELTPLGHQVHDEHLRFEEALWTKIMGALDNTERDLYVRILRKIVSRLGLKIQAGVQDSAER